MIQLKLVKINWAYEKEEKSLKQIETNIKSSIITNVKVEDHLKEEKFQEEKIENRFDISDISLSSLEHIIDFLLVSLNDKDTRVRWSAAKGLGRVASRLSKQMANDVIESVLNQFTPNATDHTWHGCCLCLGELTRRQLILPQKLQRLLPILQKALHFDILQGNYSVGSNVRDSACYIAWCFARAFKPSDLSSFITNLSQSLLITMVFDREVNCRRASSAAFQEHVGRQGQFPHGIDILTEADYFTLGSRHNSFLNVGTYICQWKEYFSAFATHVAFEKLGHWDNDVRLLSAACLARISPLNPQFIIQEILPGLLKLITSEQVFTRHGIIFGIGDTLLGLCGMQQIHNLHKEFKGINNSGVFFKTSTTNDNTLLNAGEYMENFGKNVYDKVQKINNFSAISTEIIQEITDIVQIVYQKQYLRGKGGDLMRVALLRLIQCISLCKIPLAQEQIISYVEFLEEGMKSILINIQDAAFETMSIFAEQYLKLNDYSKKLFENYLKNAQSNITFQKKVYCSALSCLNAQILQSRLKDFLDVIHKNVQFRTKKTEQEDSESRQFSLKALERVLISDINLNEKELETIIYILFKGLEDYTMDKRGDIGSLNRELSMALLQKLCKKYKVNVQLFEKIIQNLLQQLCEKIDRVRLIAGSVIQDIFNKCDVSGIQNNEELVNSFSQEHIQKTVQLDQKEIDKKFQSEQIEADLTMFKVEVQQNFIFYWNNPKAVYPIVVPLLKLEPYTYNILKGLCISIGGISESIIKYSQFSLNQLLDNADDAFLTNLLTNAIQLLKENVKSQRIINPLFNTLSIILANEKVLQFKDLQQFSLQIFQQIKSETKFTKTKQLIKLQTIVKLVVQILEQDYQNKEILEYISLLIGHEFPKIRKQIADQLQMLIINKGEEIFGEEKSEQISDFLVINNWLTERIDYSNEKKQFLEIIGLNLDQEKNQEGKKEQQIEANQIQGLDEEDEI